MTSAKTVANGPSTNGQATAHAEKSTAPPPAVKWAQRPNGLVLITICLEDCKSPLVDLKTTSLHFKGKGGADNSDHEVTLEFYGELQADLKDCTYVVRDRCIEFKLVRSDPSSAYWPRLLKDSRKQHWLKVDFDKWRDEDDDVGDDGDMANFGGGSLEEMMRSMGGVGGGPPPMGGAPGRPDLDDLDVGDDDSDDVDSDDEKAATADGVKDEDKMPDLVD